MPALKPSRLVDGAEPIVVEGPPPRFVSRGGEKLDAALERFDVTVRDRRALDAGASTGGFTHCLLQRGAAEVLALDVGYGQLASRLAADPRVVSVDRKNIRHVPLDELGGVPFEVVVADLSFISLRTVAHRLAGDLAARGADLVVLVKPQFEAGRVEVSAGRGIIRSPAVWRRTLGEVATTFGGHRAAMMDAMVSPLKGADGNVEFLLHLRPHAHEVPSEQEQGALLDAVVSAAVDREGGSQ
jgi:23S rRNA (cytidine1920-2'-O)/16S rRNA (cytidine1409-2'-O)-methyltransferase